MRPLLNFLTVVIFTTLPAASQAQSVNVRLCYAVPGQLNCQPIGAGTGLPIGAGSAPPDDTLSVGTRLVRLCYAAPGILPCQPVDASHPMPVQ